MANTFGTALLAARTRRGLSQADVAKHCGISRGRVSQWEHDRRRPSWEELSLLCQQLPDDARVLQQQAQLSSKRRGRGRDPEHKRLRQLIPPPQLYLPIQRVPTVGWERKLKREHPDLHDALCVPLRRRPDRFRVRQQLRRTACDSKFEFMLFLHLLRNGGPVTWSVGRLGYCEFPVVDETTLAIVGSRPTPGYWSRDPADEELCCIAVPHVTIRPGVRPYTLDALLLLIEKRRRLFVTGEVDGQGHDSTYDRQRREELKLPELRFGEDDVKALDFSQVFWKRVRALLAEGRATPRVSPGGVLLPG